MKTTTFVIIASFFAITATAQKLKEAEVPAAVKDAFKKRYPGTNVRKWEKEGADFEAEFKLSKTESSAVFTATGEFRSLEQEVPADAVPKNAMDYCAAHFAGYKVKETEKITEASGNVMYEIGLKNTKEKAEALFDSDGRFLSLKKD